MRVHEAAAVALRESSEHSYHSTRIGWLRVRITSHKVKVYQRRSCSSLTHFGPLRRCQCLCYTGIKGEFTHDVVPWTEGVDFGEVFVRLEALDCNLEKSASSTDT